MLVEADHDNFQRLGYSVIPNSYAISLSDDDDEAGGLAPPAQARFPGGERPLQAVVGCDELPMQAELTRQLCQALV